MTSPFAIFRKNRIFIPGIGLKTFARNYFYYQQLPTFMNIAKKLFFIPFLFLSSACNPCLQRNDAIQTLSFLNGITFFTEEQTPITFSPVSTEYGNSILLIKTSRQENFVTLWDSIAAKLGNNISFQQLASSDICWYKLKTGNLRRIPSLSGKKCHCLQTSNYQWLDFSLHGTNNRNHTFNTPAAPQRIYIGHSRWKTNTYKNYTEVRIGLFYGDSSPEIRCEVKNLGLDNWILFSTNGAVRFRFFAKGWNKAGIHELQFSPEYIIQHKPQTLVPNEWTQVFSLSADFLFKHPVGMIWKKGKNPSIPGFLPLPSIVPSVQVWFAAIYNGKAYYSPTLDIPRPEILTAEK